MGLKPGETEIQTRTIGHGAGEMKALRVARLGQGSDLGAAGVAQAEHLGGLVKGLAGGVVYRFAEQAVAPQPLDFDQLCMTTRDEQGNEGEVGGRRLKHGGHEVALHVMNAKYRNAQCASHTVCGAGAHH